MKKSDIAVSVLVMVYNHEKYLDECLNSIVKQKTNFKYEILVHDDCSTDNSKKIIEKYYNNFPDKIIPFYEKENQYYKGNDIIKNILIPNIKGKYFCFCEGDDFWIDENKLQKQYEFLENNKEYKFCVHNSIVVDKNSIKIRDITPLKEGGDLTCYDFILGGGGFVATNSIFSYSFLAKNLPKYFDYMTIDYFWQIYLSSVGKSYCFKDYMSAYRFQSVGSWSARMKESKEKYINHIEKIINTLYMVFDEIDDNYKNSVKKVILTEEFKVFKLKREYKKMKQEPYLEIWKSLSLKKKVGYFLDGHFPIFYGIIKRLLKR